MTLNINIDGNYSDTPIFGGTFLEEHAGNLIQNTNLAIIELIANSLDAGADAIDITWPKDLGGEFCISDNGIGMTDQEFRYRWMQLNYNRLIEQGDVVNYPQGNRQSKRKVFGRNGKGRYSMFCFSNSYKLITCKDGEENTYVIQRADSKKTPFTIERINNVAKNGHGTKLTATVDFHLILESNIREIIWSKFIADPAVDINVNGHKVNLADFYEQLIVENVKVEGGEIPIYFIEGDFPGRTSLQNGITWWVNGRSVGELSWRRMSEPGLFIDRRTSEGRDLRLLFKPIFSKITFISIGPNLIYMLVLRGKH